MKSLIPALAASVLLLTGCIEGGNTWGGFEPTNELARFNGTVKDTPLTATAGLTFNEYDGWIDIGATTAFDDDGTMGMMFVMGQIEQEELFALGSRSLTPMSDGGSVDILLCGEADGDYYDEPADEIVVEVEEGDAGGRDVLLRGTARNGKRFQEIRFHLDEDFVPVRMDAEAP